MHFFQCKSWCFCYVLNNICCYEGTRCKNKLVAIQMFTITRYVCKGPVPRDFRLQVFLWSVSPQPMSIPLGPFRIFSKIRVDIRRSRCTTGVVETGDKWRKSSTRKVLIIFLEHFCVIDILINFFLQVHLKMSAVQYCSNYLPPVALTNLAKIYAPSLANISANFQKKFEMTLMLFSGAGGIWFMKKPEAKISWHWPFKTVLFSQKLCSECTARWCFPLWYRCFRINH